MAMYAMYYGTDSSMDYAGRTAQPGPGGPAKILKNHARRVRNPMFHTFEHKRFRSINGFRFPVFRQFFTGIARNYRDPAAIRAFPEADFRVAAIAFSWGGRCGRND